MQKQWLRITLHTEMHVTYLVGMVLLHTLKTSTALQLTSNAIVALSVSISATESPAAKASPSFTFHSAMVPDSMVGDRAGMGTTMWYGRSEEDMCRIAMIWACGRDGCGGAEDTEYLLPGTEEKVRATAAAVTGNRCLAE